MKTLIHQNFRKTTVSSRTYHIVLILLVALTQTAPLPLFAGTVSVPAMNGPVTDTANLLSSAQKQQLSTYLNNLNTNTGIQIAVLTVESLNGASIEQYGLAAAEKWGLGQKSEDNGALLLVAFEEHELRIEVGYGLEGTLTDTKSGLIIRNVIIPYFKNSQYGKGILAGAVAMAETVAGDAAGSIEGITVSSTASRQQNTDDEDAAGAAFGFLIWLLIVIIAISSSKNKRRHYGYRRRSGFSQAAETLFWLNMLNNSNSRNHHSGSSFKSGGFGGGFGGGFSGGGGHFGGGGASGKW